MTRLTSSLRTLILSTTIVASQISAATIYHVSLEGSGTHQGESWENSKPFSDLQSTLSTMEHGDVVKIGSGTYLLSEAIEIASSGTREKPKQIIGVDTGGGLPRIVGKYNVNAPKEKFDYVGFRFTEHNSYWRLEDLRLENFGTAILMKECGTSTRIRSHITFKNVGGKNIEDFFHLTNASNITIENCDVVRYTKKGFRYANYINHVTFKNCTADATGGDETFPTRAIPNGFCGGDTEGKPSIRNVTFIDCTARNNKYAPQQRNYWNGDGFSTEEGTTRVTYIRCASFDNHDGGFDDKADNTTYIDCIAIRNAKGFRYWGNNGLLKNCLSAYNRAWGGNNASVGLWVGRQREGARGIARVIDSTFFHNSQWALEAYDGGRITATGCLIITDPQNLESRVANDGDVRFAANNVCSSSDDKSVALVSPRRNWQGKPTDAFNLRENHNSQGYNSHHRTSAKVTAP